jgi:hypothetical protein
MGAVLMYTTSTFGGYIRSYLAIFNISPLPTRRTPPTAPHFNPQKEANARISAAKYIIAMMILEILHIGHSFRYGDIPHVNIAYEVINPGSSSYD